MSAGEFWSHPLTVTIVGLAIASAGTAIVTAVRVMFQLKGILVGPDGQNGLRSEVRRALSTLDELGDDVSHLTHRVERVEVARGVAPAPVHDQYDRRHVARARGSNG